LTERHCKKEGLASTCERTHSTEKAKPQRLARDPVIRRDHLEVKENLTWNFE